MNDSIKVIHHPPYKIVQPKVRIETPLGAIESDSGNPILDGVIVFLLVFSLYICKKVVNKFIKEKKA